MEKDNTIWIICNLCWQNQCMNDIAIDNEYNIIFQRICSKCMAPFDVFNRDDFYITECQRCFFIPKTSETKGFIN